VSAFAGDETKILKSVSKEDSKVFFAIGDAGARHHLSMPEAAGARVLVRNHMVHPRPLNRCPQQSYIRAAALIMEF
jgi:hypothetical protein